jgi:hypothetical protein
LVNPFSTFAALDIPSDIPLLDEMIVAAKLRNVRIFRLPISDYACTVDKERSPVFSTLVSALTSIIFLDIIFHNIVLINISLIL